MREIKFRAWHPLVTDGEVTLPGHMDYELAHHKVLAVKTETRLPPASFGLEHIQSGAYFINADLAAYGDRLMQFTGLQDKNGKEIYEGDILNYNGRWKIPVFLEDGMFKTKDADGWSALTLRNAKSGVIGNICENPELLNEDRSPQP